MTPKIFSFLCKADLSIPTNFDVFEIFPPNFFNWDIRYSLSKLSLASLSGIDNVSVTEKLSSTDFDKDSLIMLIIFSLSSPGVKIAILSIKFLNSLTLPGQL